MAIRIKQGDEYSVPVLIRLNGEPVEIDEVDEAEFAFGTGLRKLYPGDVGVQPGGRLLLSAANAGGDLRLPGERHGHARHPRKIRGRGRRGRAEDGVLRRGGRDLGGDTVSALITADILTPGAIEAGAGTAKLVAGPRGPAGAVYTPSVTDGLLSWTNDGGLENPAPADIRGPKGDKGDPGEAGPPGADGADGAPGTGLAVLGQYDSAEALAAAVTDPALGDNYYVGESAPFDIYTWTKVGGAPQWVNGGALQGAPGGYYLPAVDAEGNLSWDGERERHGPRARGQYPRPGRPGRPGRSERSERSEWDGRRAPPP